MSKTGLGNGTDQQKVEVSFQPGRPETIVITEQEHRKAGDVFRAGRHAFVSSPANEDALSTTILAARARAVVIGTERYTGTLYSALKQSSGGSGAIIVRFGVGHDGVDKTLAKNNGVIVCNTPGVLDISVAEQTLWMIGDITRHIARLDAEFKAGKFAGIIGAELCGKKLGVLGFGRIGRRVAASAHFGFGMRVIAAGTSRPEQLEASDRRSMDEIKSAYGIERYTQDVEEIFKECDYVSVHLPAKASTRHFINAHLLSLMKPTAIIVNTARGSVLDEIALHEALVNGRIGGAALDVFEHEPYQPVVAGRDLRQLPNVLLTPHIGSNTREANQRMAEACLANLDHFFAGNFGQLTALNAH